MAYPSSIEDTLLAEYHALHTLHGSWVCKIHLEAVPRCRGTLRFIADLNWEVWILPQKGLGCNANEQWFLELRPIFFMIPQSLELARESISCEKMRDSFPLLTSIC